MALVLRKVNIKKAFKIKDFGLDIIGRDIKEFRNEIELLHGIGLKLYDITVTLPQLKSEVERLIKLDYNVNENPNPPAMLGRME